MAISSRTPEGRPNRCSICRQEFALEPPQPTGDAPCPHCGQLLWWFKDHLSESMRVDREKIGFETSFVDDLGADSLDTVELVMALEDEFGVVIPDDDAEQIHTVADAVRYIELRQRSAHPLD